MSNEQIKKDLLVQRGLLKIQIKQLTFTQEVTGIKREKEINALLDRMNLIDKVMRELENKK